MDKGWVVDSDEDIEQLLFKGEWGNRLIDLTGRKYGKLSVLGRAVNYTSSSGKTISPQWLCLCDCGLMKIIRGHHLRKGRATSCGYCARIIIGQLYDYLEPICRGLDYTNDKSGQHHAMYICICHYGAEDCKKYTIVSSGSLRGNNTKSCGCYNRERLKGDTSAFWKGGITELHNLIRTCDKNLKWKDFCRERDNYTCQKCGKRDGGKLPVHHCKIPFWKILEELVAMGITNVKDIPDDSEFWNTDNGITLCKDCHKEFHHRYGNDFTEEDYYTWLKETKDLTVNE